MSEQLQPQFQTLLSNEEYGRHLLAAHRVGNVALREVAKPGQEYAGNGDYTGNVPDDTWLVEVAGPADLSDFHNAVQAVRAEDAQSRQAA